MREITFFSWKNHTLWAGAVTIAVVATIGYSLVSGKGLAQRYAPLQDAAMEIKFEATTAHLWFEEAISGDQTIKLKTIWKHLDEALWYARAMLDGGENQEGKYLPIKEQILRQKIEKTIAGIQDFRAIAKQRWDNRTHSGVGSDMDRRFDKVFKDFIILADSVETSLQIKMNEELQRFTLLQGILIATTLLLGIFAGILLRNNARNIIKYNDELEQKIEKRTRDLESSRQQLIQAQAVGHIGSWSWDIVTGKENWSNEQFLIFGYEPNEIIPTYQHFLDAIHPEDRTMVTTAVDISLKSHEAYDLDFRIIDAKNKLRLVRAQGEVQLDKDGEPLIMVGTVQDITERSAVEASLVQTGKMATLGEMATGMAHEINQPLNAIQLAASNILNKARKGPVSDEYLVSKVNKIQKMTERAGNIINHMKVFGRTDTGEKSVVSILACVEGAVALAQHQFRIAEIDVAVDYPSIPLNVLGHQIQFEQVFLNLLINAKQAIQGRESENRKHINISFLNDEKNRNVEVCLSDTGGGVPADLINRIFEPFYTTKEVGVGTGLGLSITYGIIKESGGEIRVENTGEGARFVITLPLADKTQNAT